RGERRQVQEDDAGRREHLVEDAVAADVAEVAGDAQAGPGEDAQRDAAEVADEVAVERLLDEERRGEDEQDDGEPAEAALADPRLEVDAGQRRRRAGPGAP